MYLHKSPKTSVQISYHWWFSATDFCGLLCTYTMPTMLQNHSLENRGFFVHWNSCACYQPPTQIWVSSNTNVWIWCLQKIKSRIPKNQIASIIIHYKIIFSKSHEKSQEKVEARIFITKAQIVKQYLEILVLSALEF